MEHVDITSVHHISNFLEERMSEFLVGISFGSNAVHELMHVDNRDTHIDGKSKIKLVNSTGTYLIDTSSVKELGGPKNATLGATGQRYR
jgi:hypothetical protein